MATSSATASQPTPFDEQTFTYTIASDVIVTINEPRQLDPHKPLELIFYTLPNGNTTAQTIGRQMQPGDDWHFDIQHIGAQTRFLRGVLTNKNLVVAYLETAQKSWPAWRKAHADHPDLIPQIFSSVKDRFTNYEVRITLASHSGGGSAIFGYLNSIDQIPDSIDRLAFLDSNYAYDKSAGHADKILQWLQSSTSHFLSVLAYNDAVALLNGKTFVSAEGGTWGRSHAMLDDLGAQIKFTSATNSDGLETCTADDGRVKFLLKQNPDKKILHTVQVEKNGFIQSLLSGTQYEGQGYTYFGDRAYTNFIAK